jgi:hypothetical protein
MTSRRSTCSVCRRRQLAAAAPKSSLLGAFGALRRRPPAATRVLKQSAVAVDEWAEMLEMAMERLAPGGEEAERFGGGLYRLIDGVPGRGHAARR